MNEQTNLLSFDRAKLKLHILRTFLVYDGTQVSYNKKVYWQNIKATKIKLNSAEDEFCKKIGIERKSE